jgi:hypothetical protein
MLLAFTTQAFSRFMLFADYYINTESYAVNCENKARPILKCRGKCQMMKKMQQEEKKDEQNPDRRAENKFELPLFHSQERVFLFSVSFQSDMSLSYGDYTAGEPRTISLDIFHPPRA